VSVVVHRAAADMLHGAGQRYTNQRRRLVELLMRAGGPGSIPEILGAGRGLKQSSVYRNLAELERAGVVSRVVTDEEFGRWELSEALAGHHHHLVCSSCGRVEDAVMPSGFERSLDRTLDGLARGAGFAHLRHRLDLIGLCADCANDATA
jgi:Fur family ferric uptake transcriptional regulator